jgi:hypothetical protein
MESKRPVKAPKSGPRNRGLIISAMDIRKPAEHGDRCVCRTLALAVGCDPKMLSYNYCRTVLRKHWIVECNHGCLAAPVAADNEFKWHDVGKIDPVKAILIMNA